MDEKKSNSESDTVFITDSSSIADLLRAIIAKEEGKTVKVIH